MFRTLLTIGGAQVATMLVLLARTKTLAVVLGPELVGVMAVVDKLVGLIAQTVSLSLPYGAARFLPERWSAGPAQYRDLYVRMRRVLLSTAVAATAAALLVTFLWPAAWGEALLPYQGVVAMAIVGLPVVALVPFLQNAIAGRMEQNRAMLAGFLHAIALAAAVAGVWLGGLSGYYAAYAALGAIVVLGIGRMATRGTPPPARPAAAAEPTALGLPVRIWRFSGALLILAFLLPYAALFVHYRLLSEHGAEMAGWMQAAIGISLSVRAVVGSAHSVFLTPNVNRGGSPEERMAWADSYQITLCLLAGVAVPPLLLFPDLVVYLLYSSAFAPGAAFVLIFVLAEVVGLLSGTYQSLVVALDHMRFHVASNLAAQLLVVAAAYHLVGPLGILGAGLATLVAPVFMFAATMIFLGRAHGLRMPARVAGRSAWLLLGLLGSGWLGASLPGLAWHALFAKALAYGLICAGFAALLTDHERQRLLEALPWRRGRRA
jgi:enterobacterial common antigen flippase